jgi:ferrochelatase
MPQPSTYDAVLIVSFGGPEKMDDVLPFLENVLRGKNVPRERMLEVAHHYEQFGGVSPINEQCRALISGLVAELNAQGPQLPVYWGNRNWHPLLPDTLRQMANDGIRRALAFVTSAFSSYSSCRQYLENIARARDEAGPQAPEIHKLRAFYNHPGFIGPMIERVQEALEQIPSDRRSAATILFTAHSIPLAMAAGCQYEAQLQEACRLVSTGLQGTAPLSPVVPDQTKPLSPVVHDRGDYAGNPWRLVYQSRSGPPSQPWLAPDVCDALRELHAAGARDVVVVPIGFLSDHIEILYDLDTEARALCEQLGLNMVRARTVGTHPDFVKMIRALIVERMSDTPERLSLGCLGPTPDICPPGCCPSGR